MSRSCEATRGVVLPVLSDLRQLGNPKGFGIRNIKSEIREVIKTVARLLVAVLVYDYDRKRFTSVFVFLFSGCSISSHGVFLTTRPHLSLSRFGANTAISFSTTCTWQAYGGENTMSYFSQMLGLCKPVIHR